MAWYFFYQCSEQQPWQVALASDRERIVSEIKPFLVSVLDVDYSFQQDLSAEESLKLKYLGPAYFDFDCGEGQTVADVIPPVKEFLTNLRGKGVDLDSLRIFATGGKGFHVEMPLETVKEKIPKTGITALPYVLREIANELYCDTMDMRVYTGRKGRLWRTPNILRPNGKYKVPVTAAEVFEMTAESYAEICSAPRQFPALGSPTFSPTLGLLCHLAEEKVAKSLKARKQGKTDINLVKRFNGDWPASVKKILGGDGLADGVGFQRIALQLGIVANSLGKQEKDLLRDSEGLCDKHQSDGTRYNTFRKRQNELSRMFRYIAGNPCFSFEVGPLKALLRPEEDTSDLVGGDPNAESPGVEGGEDLISSGVRLNQGGFYVKEDYGFRKASSIGISNPMQLLKLDDGKIMGYEVTVHVDGKIKGEHALPMNSLQTKSKFMEWASGICSTSVQASDNQVASLMDLLRWNSEKNGNVVYVIPREGVDIVVPYGGSKEDWDTVWSARDRVISRKGVNYRMRGHMLKDGVFKSDLHFAQPMTDTPDMREYIRHLLNINSKINVALMLGWFFACFICQPIRKIKGEFPSMQVFGPAGAGKSKTIEAMLWLHTHQTRLLPLQSSTGSTNFPLMSAVAQSASIPVVFEEVKPRAMSKDRLNFLRDLLKNNYSGAGIKRGTLSRDAGASQVDVLSDRNEAPIAFVGESLDTESAILERCIILSLSKESREGREESFDHVYEHHHLLSSIGRSCLGQVVGASELDAKAPGIDLDKLRVSMERFTKEVTVALGDTSRGRDRPCHNLAVAMTGLEFAKLVVGSVFGSEFDKSFEDLQQVLLERSHDTVPEDISEAGKVLDTLAQMTYEHADPLTSLIYGKDYTVSEGRDTVDLALKSVYNKYAAFCRKIGQPPLYDNIGSFIAAMKHYPGLVATECPDNPALHINPLSRVFRFSVAIMERERVEPFRKI